MHEFYLIEGLIRKIQTIAQEQQADKVTLVKVKLGALAHISADHFREHFIHAVRNTVAEGANLDVEEMKDPEDPHAQEILLDSVEIEEGK